MRSLLHQCGAVCDLRLRAPRDCFAAFSVRSRGGNSRAGRGGTMRRNAGAGRCGLRVAAATALLVLAPVPLLAAQKGGEGPSEAIFIAQIIALLVCGRLLGEAMLR